MVSGHWPVLPSGRRRARPGPAPARPGSGSCRGSCRSSGSAPRCGWCRDSGAGPAASPPSPCRPGGRPAGMQRGAAGGAVGGIGIRPPDRAGADLHAGQLQLSTSALSAKASMLSGHWEGGSAATGAFGAPSSWAAAGQCQQHEKEQRQNRSRHGRCSPDATGRPSHSRRSCYNTPTFRPHGNPERVSIDTPAPARQARQLAGEFGLKPDEVRARPGHPRPRSLADRTRHLQRHVVGALLLQIQPGLAAGAADQGALGDARARARMPA